MNNEIYRDRSEGANARRLDLLRKRRDELITMPHAVRRVFVARSARISAALAMCTFGIGMLVTAAVPPVTRFFESVLPGTNPAAFSQLLLATWIVSIVVYALARSRSEHRFIVAMSKYVLPGEDVDHDIERLSHEHPDAMAKTMAEKLEVKSVALPVMAAALVLPATAIYLIATLIETGWATTFEMRIAANTWPLVAIGGIGIATGILMKRRSARLPIVAPIAGVVALVAIATAVVLSFQGVTTAWVLAPAVIALTIAILVRRLRVERTLIDAVDPAAGSELFSWRKSLAELRASIAKIRITRPMWIGAVVVSGLFLIGGRGLPGYESSTRATAAVAPALALASAEDVGIKLDTHGVMEVKGIAMDVTLGDGSNGKVIGIAGFETLPRNWKMKVVFALGEDTPAAVTVRPLDGRGTVVAQQAGTDAGSKLAELHFHSCGSYNMPLGFSVDFSVHSPSATLDSTSVRLDVQPRLVYEPCEQ